MTYQVMVASISAEIISLHVAALFAFISNLNSSHYCMRDTVTTSYRIKWI